MLDAEVAIAEMAIADIAVSDIQRPQSRSAAVLNIASPHRHIETRRSPLLLYQKAVRCTLSSDTNQVLPGILPVEDLTDRECCDIYTQRPTSPYQAPSFP